MREVRRERHAAWRERYEDQNLLVRKSGGEMSLRRIILTCKVNCRRRLNEMAIVGEFNWLWMGLLADVSGGHKMFGLIIRDIWKRPLMISREQFFFLDLCISNSELSNLLLVKFFPVDFRKCLWHGVWNTWKRLFVVIRKPGYFMDQCG
jgi:hypothetical protein